MIILDTTSRSLQAVLNGAAATTNPVYVCSFVDITSTAFVPGTKDGSLNGGTAVTIMASPAASTQRQLKYFSLFNGDTAPVTVTFMYNDSSTLNNIFATALPVGYRIEYTGENGFKVYDVNGNLRSSSSTTANYYQTVQVNGSNQPQEGVMDFSSEFANTDDPSNNRSKIGINAIAESKVTNLTTDLAAKLALAGGTMSGNLILNADPSTALGAATKQYVDNSIRVLNQKPTADVATTTTLPANTYANGTAGVGATLTGNSNGALASIDTVAPYANMIVLVKNEVTAANNGLYVLTQVGDGSHPYILTRSSDMDASTEFVGAFTPIDNEGSANKNTMWLMNYQSSFTTGTTAVNFTQMGGVGYTADESTLHLSGTVFSMHSAPPIPSNATTNTQSQYDNSTKLATTAYVDSASHPLIYSLIYLSNN